jgi:hypothetical protein
LRDYQEVVANKVLAASPDHHAVHRESEPVHRLHQLRVERRATTYQALTRRPKTLGRPLDFLSDPTGPRPYFDRWSPFGNQSQPSMHTSCDKSRDVLTVETAWGDIVSPDIITSGDYSSPASCQTPTLLNVPGAANTADSLSNTDSSVITTNSTHLCGVSRKAFAATPSPKRRGQTPSTTKSAVQDYSSHKIRPRQELSPRFDERLGPQSGETTYKEHPVRVSSLRRIFDYASGQASSSSF